jgi:hypothetical protein
MDAATHHSAGQADRSGQRGKTGPGQTVDSCQAAENGNKIFKLQKNLTVLYKTVRLYHDCHIRKSPMARKKFRLITCHALAPVLLPLLGPDTDVEVLDIGLHASPQRLRERVQEQVTTMEDKGVDLCLGYGLCGRGLEGVCSSQTRLIIPRIDDCVGALLGSKERHRRVLKKFPGAFFLEPTWLDTEMNIFSELARGMEHFTAERRRRIVALALKNYHTIAMLVTGKPDPRAVDRCEAYAQAFDLEVRQISTDLDLLKRLITGPLDQQAFVITSPGQPVPFF